MPGIIRILTMQNSESFRNFNFGYRCFTICHGEATGINCSKATLTARRPWLACERGLVWRFQYCKAFTHVSSILRATSRKMRTVGWNQLQPVSCQQPLEALKHCFIILQSVGHWLDLWDEHNQLLLVRRISVELRHTGRFNRPRLELMRRFER